MATEGRVRVALGGVPETLLWTLYHRAAEARRGDAVLDDPLAVELVERIDYPFAQRFGSGGFGQWQALRARCFDDEVRRFLDRHPDGTVVALGEGLETQFWRVDNGRVRWLTVDVPETIDLRERLLPDDPRRRAVAGSALDDAWLDEVDTERGVLMTAQGLLMYFERADVHALIARCAARLPGAGLVFDAVPAWLSRRTRSRQLRTAEGYRPPPWLWGMDPAEERAVAALPGVAELRALRLPHGRGVVHGLMLPALARLDPARRLMLSVFSARFADRG
jgi:O-methyltransferase involved in polyketide biosynthesis